MRSTLRLSVSIRAALLLTVFARPAHAAPLLTPSYEAQLETWLGQGDLTFTNVYTKAAGHDASDFHAATDGQGATFTLLQGIYQGTTYVIGGYNPQGWSSVGDFHYTFTDAERTAFIYNLTTGVQQRQRVTTDPFNAEFGNNQTYNGPTFGPIFGGGPDLQVDGTLSVGYAFQFAYGNGSPCSNGGTNIVGFPYYEPSCSTLTGHLPFFLVGELEGYTFAPTTAVVPEPTSLLLLGTGLTGLVMRRYRRTWPRQSAPPAGSR